MPSIRQYRSLSAVVFCTLTSLVQNAPTGAQGAGTGALTGIVWDSVRSQPIAGAEVVLLNTRFGGVTNAEGRFFIPNLPAGSYKVTFAHRRLDSIAFALQAVHVTIQNGAQAVVEMAIGHGPNAELNAAELDTVVAWLGQIGVQIDANLHSRIRGVGGERSDLHGTVVEKTNRRGIPSAMVKLEGTGFAAVTDPVGRFAFNDLAPGTYRLRVEMLGFAERREQIDVAPGKVFDLRIDMSPQALALPPLVVVARSRSLDRAGFYERKHDRSNWGRFFTATDPALRHLLDFADLFNQIQGAKVLYGGIGRKQVIFSRGVGSSPTCVPPVFVDGQPLADAFSVISPAWIEGIEIYVGSKTPIEFAGGGAGCGAILVWTKRGG